MFRLQKPICFQNQNPLKRDFYFRAFKLSHLQAAQRRAAEEGIVREAGAWQPVQRPAGQGRVDSEGAEDAEQGHQG